MRLQLTTIAVAIIYISISASFNICSNELYCLSNTTLKKCHVDGDKTVCPINTVKCFDRITPICSEGRFYPEFSRCLVHLNRDGKCNGEKVINGMCDAGEPKCKNGKYNKKYKACFPEGYPCPKGPKYDCLDIGNQWVCSELSCGKLTKQQDNTGQLDKNNNGSFSLDGKCLGSLYIFNGKDMRCKSWILDPLKDCCDNEEYILGACKCNEQELKLFESRRKNICVKVGKYCSQKIDIGIKKICLEKTTTYCCFSSVLARIVHEQLRPELKSFKAKSVNILGKKSANTASVFGIAKAPQCRGFTPEEFQMLDLNSLDLSEWYDYIESHSNFDEEALKRIENSNVKNDHI